MRGFCFSLAHSRHCQHRVWQRRKLSASQSRKLILCFLKFIYYYLLIKWLSDIFKGRKYCGGEVGLSVAPTRGGNRSVQSTAARRGVSLHSAAPASSSISTLQSEGGLRDAWPDSGPLQPPSSDSQRGFSHSRPVWEAGQLQRLFTHSPPFWQRRSSLSHTRAAAKRMLAEEKKRVRISCAQATGDTLLEGARRSHQITPCGDRSD